MKIPMKVLDYELLLALNKNSEQAKRSQHIMPDQLPAGKRKPFIINFYFDHEWNGKRDIRCSVILEPGIRTVWLDVSPEEFDSIKTVEMPELDWEAAVCVGIPAWVK